MGAANRLASIQQDRQERERLEGTRWRDVLLHILMIVFIAFMAVCAVSAVVFTVMWINASDSVATLYESRMTLTWCGFTLSSIALCNVLIVRTLYTD